MNQPLMKFKILLFAVTVSMVGLASTANAQRPIRHELIRSDMAPGIAAQYYRMGDRRLENHTQAVRFVGPHGSRIEVGSKNGYVATNSSRVTLGMAIGPVYRLKVTNIPQNFGKELYPSIEVLNRLNPPKDLENEFPIEVVLSEDDLKQALGGHLVTKVIYLEDPETALPHRHRDGEQPYFDVGGGEDPLRAAEKLGRPMAILRIGSRVPMPSDATERFNFNSPDPVMLPEPQMIQQHNWNGVEDMSSPVIPGRVIPIEDDK